MDTEKSVALLIPCYNASQTLGKVLEDASVQSTPFSEIICYIDGEDFETEKLAQQKGAKVIHSRVNKGPAFARNCLLHATQADFIYFHDADDPIHPEFLSRLKPQLTKDTTLFCQTKVFYQKKTEGQDLLYKEPLPQKAKEWVDFFINNFVHLNSTLFSRSQLIEAGGFDNELQLYEDKCLFLKLALLGSSFKHVPEFLAFWEKADNSQMFRQGWKKHNLNILQLAQKVYSFMEQRETPDELKEKFGHYIMEKAWNCYYASGHAHQLKEIYALVLTHATLAGSSYKPNALIKTLGIENFFRLRKSRSSRR